MKRRNFILTTLTAMPAFGFTQIKTLIAMRTNKGFKIVQGQEVLRFIPGQ